MNILKRLKNSIKRGAEMIIKGIEELIEIVPCDKRLVVNITKDVVLAIGGGFVIGAILIAGDLNAYDRRMENGDYIQ